MLIISSFSGQYRFLSNFYPSPMIVASKAYPMVEHLFQASKTIDETWHEKIRLASTPSEAKRIRSSSPVSFSKLGRNQRDGHVRGSLF